MSAQTASMNNTLIRVRNGLAASLVSLGLISIPTTGWGDEILNKSPIVPSFDKYLIYPWEAIKLPELAASYRKTFGPYWSLQWVKSPVLGEAGTIVHDPELGPVVKYRICKPHACESERLVFIYKPATQQGWGKIRIDSEVLGDRAGKSIERFVTKQLDEVK
jgi:hypothetical protein